MRKIFGERTGAKENRSFILHLGASVGLNLLWEILSLLVGLTKGLAFLDSVTRRPACSLQHTQVDTVSTGKEFLCVMMLRNVSQ